MKTEDCLMKEIKMREEELKKNKKVIILLEQILKECNSDIVKVSESFSEIDNDSVIITYKNGHTKKINIEGDSPSGIVCDVIRIL